MVSSVLRINNDIISIMLLSGTDLTTVSRFKNKSQKFAEKILSEQEYVQFQKMEDERQKSLFLARVWAIKESIYKVLIIVFMILEKLILLKLMEDEHLEILAFRLVMNVIY
ncbi:4'-phosphopantetheinyl transferase superfamily protein [Mycoplasmopsis cynos]|uniref:4'-phosphopantetheinyl transferase superfamily protein n=1 Tax=Mycoplasmopsis cynos TaxID=171284 RepID=UPI0024C99996|nr:4'-phosphopantetheinyl transferase superfamily protein [Mycoplasmopsis cynos]WAM07921.1 4'-phosphopantetheinyl transferase superfamily protein [Mycoplasmopsis cynos]